jgi:hypothetical protein
MRALAVVLLSGGLDSSDTDFVGLDGENGGRCDTDGLAGRVAERWGEGNGPFRHFLIQPMDCADAAAVRNAAIGYALEHPRWRLSLQTHKLLGLP